MKICFKGHIEILKPYSQETAQNFENLFYKSVLK